MAVISDIVMTSMSDEDVNVVIDRMNAELKRHELSRIPRNEEEVSQLCEEVVNQGFGFVFKPGINEIQFSNDSDTILVQFKFNP